MADSRQTKIVTYELQGDTTSLMSELQNAVKQLDVLDQKLTQISSSARMVAGKDKTSFARAKTISAAESTIGNIRTKLNPENIQSVSPDQLNLLKQMNKELGSTIGGFDRFKNATTVSQKALDKTRATLNTMNTALRQSKIATAEATSGWKSFTTAVSKITAVISVIKMLVSYLGKLYEASAEYVEVMNLFNVATKESSDNLYELAENMSKAYNTDIQPLLNSIAVFRQYANTMGFAAAQADVLSEGLTSITYDLASLYNTTNEDMFSAVKSALAGQTKPLMRYGISVHSATLEQYALQLGLNKTVATMNETEKVALRYIAILDQATLAQGDLAKTLESPSNQLKIAKSQLTIFVRSLGQLVTTISTYVLPVFNGLMIAVNNFVDAMSKAAGFTIENYSDNLSSNNQMLDEGADSAEEYADAMKGVLAPLDEINQASTSNDDKAFGTIDPAILAALENYDNLMDQISTKTDQLAAAFGAILDPKLFEGVGSVIGVAFETIGAGIEIFGNALAAVSPILSVVLNLLGLLLEGASWLITTIVSPVLDFITALTSNIWLLIAAFTSLNIVQLAATGNFKSMIAVKIGTWFAGLTANIIKNTAAFIANAAASIKAKAASLALAVALWWETAAWWQKVIAMIAAAGTMALVVLGIVTAATVSAKATADRTMNSNNIPAMARGGVVSSPTVALIGEGRYNEAVVPLGNSPQFKTMKDDIANEVSRKNNPAPRGYGSTSRAGTPVILNLNGREIARAILPDLGYAQPQTGVKLSR